MGSYIASFIHSHTDFRQYIYEKKIEVHLMWIKCLLNSNLAALINSSTRFWSSRILHRWKRSCESKGSKSLSWFRMRRASSRRPSDCRMDERVRRASACCGASLTTCNGRIKWMVSEYFLYSSIAITNCVHASKL